MGMRAALYPLTFILSPLRRRASLLGGEENLFSLSDSLFQGPLGPWDVFDA